MKCPVCDFEIDHFPSLARHVQQKHSGAFCPICGVKVKFLVKHARQHSDERHQLLYRCLWQESRTRSAKRRLSRNAKPNGNKKPRTPIYLNEIVDMLAKCRKEHGIRSCEFCSEVLGCETVKMLIERLAARI
jgi:uncharacterized Zn finger protein (UPF0148 family)